MRTYSDDFLRPHDPTNPTWALMWARRFAGDVPIDEAWLPWSLTDYEWMGWLEATAIRTDSATYYRPHEAAARVVGSNPNRPLSLVLPGTSQQYRSPQEAANAIRRDGQWVDELIRSLAGIAPEELAPRW